MREWSQIADGVAIIPAIRKVNVDNENPMSVNGYMTMSYNEEQFQAVKEFYAVSGRAQVISIDIKHFERAGWETLPDVKVGRRFQICCTSFFQAVLLFKHLLSVCNNATVLLNRTLLFDVINDKYT